MPDYSQPGSHGAIPFSLSEWRRGVVYTVRPEILAPLERGREYSIVTLVRRAPRAERSGFGDLYQRAAAFARLRASEVMCESPGEPLHTWTDTHAWLRIEAGPHRSDFAAITTRLMFPPGGGAKPEGEPPPSPAMLREPGGAAPEGLAAKYESAESRRITEIFNDFDFAADPGGPGLFSYGEYVASSEGVDFAPFIERAGRRARLWDSSIEIMAREWFCATNPDLAVIHLYYDKPAAA